MPNETNFKMVLHRRVYSYLCQSLGIQTIVSDAVPIALIHLNGNYLHTLAQCWYGININSKYTEDYSK